MLGVVRETRCLVDLGRIDSARAIRHSIERIASIRVRTEIEDYLTVTGVAVGRTLPQGWFDWLDATAAGTSARFFSARCADPPSPDDGDDDGYQPWNYFVIAEVRDRSAAPWQAAGLRFVHESLYLP
jgi:hypothetical protein